MAIWSPDMQRSQTQARDYAIAIENWRNGIFCKRPYKLPVWRPKVDVFGHSVGSPR